MATGNNPRGQGNWPQKYQVLFPDQKEPSTDGSLDVCVGKYIKDPTKAPPGSKLVTKTSKVDRKVSNFIAYDFITGHLHDLKLEVKEIGGKKFREAIAILSDEAVIQELTLGSTKGSFFRDFLKRILDPNFNPAFPLVVQPYHMIAKNDKDPSKPFDNSGLSMKSSGVKLSAAKYQPAGEKPEANLHLKDMPAVERREDELGDMVSDSSKQIKWLLDEFYAKVLPRLPKLPEQDQAPATPPPPAVPPPTQEYPTAPAQADQDDLPF